MNKIKQDRYSYYGLPVREIVFFILCMMGFSFLVSGQIITTIAGVSASGYNGDGIPATAAWLRFPTSPHVDSLGNLYIVDGGNYRIRKINTSGIISTIAGNGTVGFSGDGGPATNAQLNGPWDMELDRVGNIYIADWSGSRIRKIDGAGIITTIAGNGFATNTGDGGPATAATVSTDGIAIDNAGNLYIAAGSTIRKIDAAGIIRSIAGTGTIGFSGDGGPATAAEMAADDIDFDKSGNMYITDKTNYRVRKIDTAGIISTVAGNGISGYSGDGGPATAAQIGLTEGISVDNAANIYITDRYNNRIRKVDALGMITTFAGNGTFGFMGDGGPATAAELNFVARVGKYGGGNVYIAERHRIRMVTDTNHAVHINGGHALLFNVCAASVSIDSLLAGMDTDTGQVDRWSLIGGPIHGSVNAAYVTHTTGSVIIPTGLTYTPTPGYTGYDTFRVQMTDGYTSDTTAIYVRVDTSLPYAGVITGIDTVCLRDTIWLNDVVPGGVWSANNAKASVAGGMVIGLSAGIDTVMYIASNACGMDTAWHKVVVKACVNGASPLPASKERVSLHMWPNPNGGAFVFSLSSGVNEPVSVVITNMVGVGVQEFGGYTNSEKEVKLDVPAGMYFISAITMSGVWSGKVVVR